MSSECKVCSQPTSLACICGDVSYCSSPCQKTDWASHKKSCPPVVVRKSPGKGQGVFAIRNFSPGQVIWSEPPVITYRKDPKATKEYFLEMLYKRFLALDEEKQRKLLALYDPGEEPERSEEKWRVARICNVNEVGGKEMINAVFEKYSRLNHSCCRNSVGQVSEDGRHQVRAVKKITKGEELTVTYLEGKLAIRDERQDLLGRKWGFSCDCPVCKLPEEESRENDKKIHYVREKQVQVTKREYGSKSGRSHTQSLQDLHRLLAACYRIEEQNQTVLRCVLLAILQGVKKVGAKEKDWSVFCPQDVRPALQERLGENFWRDPDNYEKEAMRVANIFGYGKKMIEYM